MQTTSEDKGIPFLEAHEGVVLTAYRCPAGKWTIGAGLTVASGVVRPRAGMTITRAEASRLLKLALARSYEPAVRQALGARTGAEACFRRRGLVPLQHPLMSRRVWHDVSAAVATGTPLRRYGLSALAVLLTDY